MILELLNEYSNVPSFLILNKIDKLKSKRALLDLVKSLTCNNLSLEEGKGKKAVKEAEVPPQDKDREIERDRTDEGGWPNFKGVFMVSSLNGDGVEKVVDFIESQAVVNPWEFKNNEITDQTPTQLIEQFVRARLLDYLPQVCKTFHNYSHFFTFLINFQEIPYLLSPQLEYFSDENNKVFASVIVTCPNKRIEMLVCGVGDGKLRQITDRVTSDLIQSFKVPVSLTLTTVVLGDKKK